MTRSLAIEIISLVLAIILIYFGAMLVLVAFANPFNTRYFTVGLVLCSLGYGFLTIHNPKVRLNKAVIYNSLIKLKPSHVIAIHMVNESTLFVKQSMVNAFMALKARPGKSASRKRKKRRLRY